MYPTARPFLPLSLAAALAALAAPGCAARGFRLAVVEENDVFNVADGLDVDRDYTQGGTAAVTLRAEDTPGWAKDAARAIPFFARESPVHLGILLGQEIFTPVDPTLHTPPADDRPYAGWLHAGLAIQSPVLDEDPVRRRDRLDHFQADVGVVGPGAGAKRAQDTFHGIFGIDRWKGWKHQVENEPGLLLTWESRWRILAGDFGGSGWQWDLLPRLQVRAGNVRTDATAGAMARFGWETPRDFGPLAVDARGLALAAGPNRPWACLFAAADARGVARDLFLQGNTFRDSPGVTPTRIVRSGTLGIAWGIGPFSASFGQVWLSPEFRERARFHRTSSLLIAWTFVF